MGLMEGHSRGNREGETYGKTWNVQGPPGSSVGFQGRVESEGVTKNEPRKWPDGDRPWVVIYRRWTVNSFQITRKEFSGSPT